MRLVKIYGERNSGTIYIEWLLKNNFDIKIIDTPDLGWKHRLAPTEDELKERIKKEVIFVCIIKNPYSWLLSMHKRPYQHEELRKLPFSRFLKYSYGDYRNPIVMWNLKYQSYIKMQRYANNFHFIRFEDLLTDMKTSLNGFASKFDLEIPAMYKNIQSQLSNSHGVVNQKFHKDFYVEEKWIKNLKPHHIELINQHIDKNLLNLFNYSVL